MYLNTYHKQKFLRQIILSSFLSALSITLTKFFKEIGIFRIALLPPLNVIKPIQNIIPYIKFLPLQLMSFYVPKRLSCVASFLADFFGFFLIMNNKRLNYSYVASIACVFCFGLIPGWLLKKEDSFLKFYFVIMCSSILFQILSWYDIFKCHYHIDILDKRSSIKIFFCNLVIRLSIVPPTSFWVVIILKKLFKRLQFLTETKELS